MAKFTVKFEPEGKSVSVDQGLTITKAADLAGIVIDSPCGGKGTCGKCKVIVNSQNLEPLTESEERLLSIEEVNRGYRLACQAIVSHDMIVNVPDDSRIRAIKTLSEGTSYEIKLHPNISKIYLEIKEQTLENQISDFTNIKKTLNRPDLKADLNILRQLPMALRKAKFKVTLVLDGNKLIGIEPGDTTKKNFGLAIDIGTTTVVCTVVDLNTGHEKAVASALNAQATHGADVVSRINYTAENEKGLEELGDRVMQVINQISEYACAEAHVDLNNVYEVTIVGNTTMTHLFLKIPVCNLAILPYVGAVSDPVESSASELGFNINPNANIYVLPNIAGFVGADTVGVILASELNRSDKIKLAIDIGTNGEIVLGSKERLLTCSTAAGPAFEGAMITHGMRGAPGAIERVQLADRPILQVIEGGNPIGICGSGLIDVIAEMLRLGIVDETGRMVDPEDIDLSSKLRKYLRKDEEYGPHLVLYEDNDNKIVINQKDIRQVQLAKGAIRAGIEILMRKLGIGLDDISEVLLAGAFGNYIRKENAIRMGLIPEFPLEKVKFIGNAAAVGAKMALMSKEARDEAVLISKTTEYVELATDPEFQNEFMEAMMFPQS
ncbi:MAG: ASKHA domain-containing protein [bacterium]